MYFRDFYFDGKYAFGESDFFEIPRDMNQVLEYIELLHSAGGDDSSGTSPRGL